MYQENDKSQVFKVHDFSGKEIEIYPRLMLVEVKDFMGEIHHNIGLGFDFEEDGQKMPFASFTVNFGEYIGMKDCAYIDTNNCYFAKSILDTGIATDTGLTKQSGFCTYPLWHFNKDFLMSVDEAKYEAYSNEYDEYMDSMCPAEEEPTLEM